MVGSDYCKPVMYEDIGKYYTGMNPMMYGMYGMGMMPYGMGMMNPYYGHVQLKPILDHDKVQIMNKHKQEDKSLFKKAMVALGVILTVGFIPTVYKGIKKSGGLISYIKNVYNGTVPKGPSVWSKIKSGLGKFGSKTKSASKNFGSRAKSVFGKVGTSISSGFKKAGKWLGGLFGRKPAVPTP